MLRRFAAAGLLVAGFAPLACTEPVPDPDPAAVRQPGGVMVSPDGRWLFATSGNWDQKERSGTLVTLSMEGLDEVITAESDAACGDDEPLEVSAAELARPELTVWLGTGVGNLAMDRPAGETGALRLLTPVREPSSVVWIDVVPDGDDIEMNCGQGGDARCDDVHRIASLSSDPGRRMPDDPARVVVGNLSDRFAYVPHLVDSRLSLIALDGDFGPELTDIESDFYRPDPLNQISLEGGYSVAQRPCDPDNPPTRSADCVRPFLYSTARFWPGVREFTVAPGLDVILAGSEQSLLGVNPEVVEARPYMGDLAFEDPDSGDSLLVVHTTPSALTRVDTSLDGDGAPLNEVRDTVKICDNPNVLAVHRPRGREWLAVVSCFGDDRVAVVGLGSFSVIRSVPVGAGPNEMTIDPRRDLLFVANTRDNSISVVGLDPSRCDYLVERARIR